MKTNKLYTSGGVPSVKKWQTGLFTGLNIYCSPSHLTAKLTKHICDIYNSSEKNTIAVVQFNEFEFTPVQENFMESVEFCFSWRVRPPGPAGIR